MTLCGTPHSCINSLCVESVDGCYNGSMSTWSIVSFECTLRVSTRQIEIITSSVPQGAILSLPLFNVMMRDIPKVNNVTYSKHADVITIYCVDSDIVAATTNIQNAIDHFYLWTKDWGLTLNHSKTKAMSFTKKRINPILLNVNNVIVEFIEQHKFLGIMLDAPSLSWKSHVNYIKETSLSRVNLLKSI